MKVLSLQAPWSAAVVDLAPPWAKRVECRRWSTRYRGPILIHASKGVGSAKKFDHETNRLLSILDSIDPSQERSTAFRDAYLSVSEDRQKIARWRPHSALTRGGLVGRAQIVDVIPKHTGWIESLRIAQSHHVDLRWWFEDQYGFVLEKVEVLPFFACRGSLGLFDASAEMVEHVAKYDTGRAA